MLLLNEHDPDTDYYFIIELQIWWIIYPNGIVLMNWWDCAICGVQRPRQGGDFLSRDLVDVPLMDIPL